jgi:glycosyltransferase involved in cell wall biosynthesis
LQTRGRGGTHGLAAAELSVVVACKNEAAHLPALLESLKPQIWTGSWEVVFADNGSTDGTTAVLERHWKSLPRPLLVDASDRPGAPHARNKGAESSSGAKLLFVDADDVIADGYIAAMAAALDRAPIVCARIGFDTLNPRWAREVWPRSWQQEGPLDQFRFLPFAGAGTLGVRREIFEQAGGFDPRFPAYEEADLCWRMQMAGHPAPGLVPGAVLEYRLPRQLSTMYRRGQAYARGELTLYRLYARHGMPQRRWASMRDLAGAVRRIRGKRDLARAAVVAGRLVGQRAGPAAI